MKIIIAIISLSIITGCASTQPTVIDYASDGTVLKMTSNMSGKQIAKLESVKAAELSNQAYYSAQQAKYSKLTDGRDVALVDAIAALSGNNSPTNYNDALIEQSKASVAKHQAWSKTPNGIKGSVILDDLAENVTPSEHHKIIQHAQPYITQTKDVGLRYVNFVMRTDSSLGRTNVEVHKNYGWMTLRQESMNNVAQSCECVGDIESSVNSYLRTKFC